MSHPTSCSIWKTGAVNGEQRSVETSRHVARTGAPCESNFWRRENDMMISWPQLVSCQNIEWAWAAGARNRGTPPAEAKKQAEANAAARMSLEQARCRV